MLEREILTKMLVAPCMLLLWLTSSVDAERSYHVALPGIVVPASATNVAMLHVSETSAVVTTAVGGCDATVGANHKLLGNPSCAGLLPGGVENAQKGIHVTGGDNLDLHVLPVSSSGSPWGDGYLAIPDEHLGTEYYVATYCTLGGKCQFSVVGTEDSTSVSITFPQVYAMTPVCGSGVPDHEGPEGTTLPFTINENDVLHFQSDNDISGTYIKADKNVAVFAGAVDLPDGNFIFEQLPPTSKWMRNHVVIPNDLNDAGDIIKIVTMRDNTDLQISAYSGYRIPKKGTAIERRVDWRMFSEVTSSNPVLIVQVMSVDLYNDTANVGGPPAMVLVQSPEHWTTQGKVVCSDTAADTHSFLLSAVGNEISSFPFNSGIGSPAFTEMLQGSLKNVSVVNKNGTFDTDDAFSSASSIKFGLSTYCRYGNSASASAMLASADWTADMEDCVPTLSTPGDDIDNDCNGMIDEVNCTAEDLVAVFSSNQADNGSTQQRTFSVATPGYMKFHVETQSVADINLWCETDPAVHASVQISPGLVTGHVEGESSSFTPAAAAAIDSDFWIRWERATDGNIPGNVTVGTGTSMGTPNIILSTMQDCFNKITFQALVGDANFTVQAGKDCGKIVEDNERDNHGRMFVVPVNSSDAYTVHITSAIAGTYKVYDSADPNTDLKAGALSAGTTDVDSTSISGLNNHPILTTTVPASAYLIKGKAGLHLLPTDILGPSYHAVTSDSGTKCSVYSVDREIDVNHLSTVTEFGSTDFTGEEFLQGQQVMPVFCGDTDNAFLQMPPRESLHHKYYVPAVDFVTAEVESAIINVLTTEDSTYIKILGDYDREDIEDLTNTLYQREFVTDQLFTIETSKPVMAYAVFEFTGQTEKVPVILTPVEQYKERTWVPQLSDYDLTHSSFVDNNGATVTPNPDITDITTNWHDQSFTSPAFGLYFIKKNDGSNNYHIFTSDFQLNDLNELCELGSGNNTDQDDDCDGLTDEETCELLIVAGAVDYDIDGGINEDCAPGGTYTVSSFALNVSATAADCSALSGGGGTVPPPTTIVPPTTMPVGTETGSGSVVTPTIPPEVLPEYEPPEDMALSAVSVPLGTDSTDPSANTTEPVKYCDCVCPCGWVIPKNMTEMELKEKVAEIQEKLKLEKKALSAFIRTKTSATDDRPSATAVGSAGVTFLVITLTAVVLLDLASLIRDLRLLRDNLRQAFEM